MQWRNSSWHEKTRTWCSLPRRIGFHQPWRVSEKADVGLSLKMENHTIFIAFAHAENHDEFWDLASLFGL